MAQRITGKMIDRKIGQLNEMLNGSADYYGANAIVAAHAYEWYAVEQIDPDGHGSKKIVNFGTAREVWNELNAFMNGMEFQKQLANKQGESK